MKKIISGVLAVGMMLAALAFGAAAADKKVYTISEEKIISGDLGPFTPVVYNKQTDKIEVLTKTKHRNDNSELPVGFYSENYPIVTVEADWIHPVNLKDFDPNTAIFGGWGFTAPEAGKYSIKYIANGEDEANNGYLIDDQRDGVFLHIWKNDKNNELRKTDLATVGYNVPESSIVVELDRGETVYFMIDSKKIQWNDATVLKFNSITLLGNDENPGTSDAIVIGSLITVISLAGVVIASRKRISK